MYNSEHMDRQDTLLKFRELAARHQRLLYSIALSYADRNDVDDIVQQTWEIAVRKYHQLENPERFASWISRICRNVIIENYRKTSADSEVFEDEILYGWDRHEKQYTEYESLLRLAIQLLSAEHRDVVQLRYFSGLSYTEIAAVKNLEVKTVKSRLHEARQKLKAHLNELYIGLEISQKKLDSMEEYAVNELKKSLLGADVFCRLSLYSQVELVKSVKSNAELSEDLLKEIGKVKTGMDFIKEYHKIITLPELVGILAGCDRFTETRLVNELEQIDPAAAEFVKQNSFVFEDLVILSEGTRRRLYEMIEHKVLLKAMSIVDRKVKKILLSDFSTEEQHLMIQKIGEGSSDIEEVRKAQFEILQILRDMNERNEVEIAGLP